MKLSNLSAKPKLVLITIDDEATVKEYGEAIEFHTWDRQPMATFMSLAKSESQGFDQMFPIVKELILDENAKQILTADNMLPTSILMKAIGKVVEMLGK